MWDELTRRCESKALVGNCGACSKSQAKKDTEQQVAKAEVMRLEDTLADMNIVQANEPIAAPTNGWCCMHWVLSLKDDFANEKPLLQHHLEACGHVGLSCLSPTASSTQLKYCGVMRNTRCCFIAALALC